MRTPASRVRSLSLAAGLFEGLVMAAIPLSETVIHAVAQLVDDSNNNGRYREPTHSDIEFQVRTAGLATHDPKHQGQNVGKAKRVRAILYAALDVDQAAGAKLVGGLLVKVRACGGFREASDNYVGAEAIDNARAAFEAEGFVLGADGSLSAKVLDSLRGAELTGALRAYAARAQKGSEDAALLSGTGKDLMEATAAHVLTTLGGGSYNTGLNFQGLLGMAFIALDLAVPELPAEPGESPVKGLERALFQSAVAVNRIRNRQGTGHGRPWLPTIANEEAKAGIEVVGAVSAYMLAKLAKKTRG
jgi:hypothetical protein